MNLGSRRVWMGALACALMANTADSLEAQTAPMRFRVGMVKLKSGGQYDFEEAMKLANPAYKKSGTSWRQVWRPAIFGEMNTAVTVSAVSKYAQFDGEGPMAQLSAADRVKYTTLVRNSVESVTYSLSETVPSLSIDSGRTAPPKFARVTVLVVQPGKNQEFEEMVRTLLMPALKRAGVKDYWVSKTLVGGPLGQYTILHLFDQWAELDALPTTEKILGPESYKQFMSKVAGSIDTGENMVMTMDANLSYRP